MFQMRNSKETQRRVIMTGEADKEFVNKAAHDRKIWRKIIEKNRLEMTQLRQTSYTHSIISYTLLLNKIQQIIWYYDK